MYLEVKGLKKKYETLVLKNVSFKLESGKVYSLLGQNGAGKTTLMKILSGIIGYDEGEILHSAKDLKKITYYVPDNPVFFEYLTGREHLTFICRLHRIQINNKKMEMFLEEYNLSDISDKFVVDYSYGMRNKLAVAMAIITSPKILLLDEPLASLDPLVFNSFKKQLIQYSRKNNIVVVSTHILSIAHNISDEILILNNGTIDQKINDFTEKEFKDYVLNNIWT